MSDCLFCKIVDGDIPGDIVYDNESVLAFNDIEPQAPHHVLIIPKKHIPTMNEMTDEDRDVLGDLNRVAIQIAKERGISDSGYRTVLNCNRGGGQAVFHIHLHLLGGRQMNWPPG